jgi:hypothetical protein
MANYTTEILPYGLRAKGFTWLNFCVTAALFDGDAVDVGEVARADMKERGVMMTEVDSKGPRATEIETR